MYLNYKARYIFKINELQISFILFKTQDAIYI